MTTETSDWVNSPLHAALVNALPIFVKEPFASQPKLNILELKKAIEKSHETVYKWLRTNRLNTRNARRIVDLANTAENRAALTKLGRKPPKIEDFATFYLA